MAWIQLLSAHLFKLWSLAQISSTFYNEGILNISHETIYQHVWLDRVYGGNLHSHLRQAQKKRRKRYNAYDSRGVLAGKAHISERPQIINKRSRIGDWEIDLVMGSDDRDCILTPMPVS